MSPPHLCKLAFYKIYFTRWTARRLVSDRLRLRRNSIQAKVRYRVMRRIAGVIGVSKRPGRVPKRPRPFSEAAIIDNYIKRLRRIEAECFGPRHKKTDFYRYLKPVLKGYLKWKDDKKRKKSQKLLAELYPKRVKVRRDTHTIRSIIDASSKQDMQVKSRWANALIYVVRNRVEVEKIGLSEFFAKNGGPAGCARKMSAIRRAKKKGRSPVPAPKGTVRSSGP